MKLFVSYWIVNICTWVQFLPPGATFIFLTQEMNWLCFSEFFYSRSFLTPNYLIEWLYDDDIWIFSPRIYYLMNWYLQYMCMYFHFRIEGPIIFFSWVGYVLQGHTYWKKTEKMRRRRMKGKNYFSKFYGKVGSISWVLFHLIWKNYVLYWDFDLKSWIVDFFTREKTPQNNFPGQIFSVENNYWFKSLQNF